MDVRQIEYFTEVAKQLNFTRAASTLHISQPSLSKTIKNLETELGIPLFYRGAKQLELTDVGKAFLVNAQNVLDTFANLTSELDEVIDLKKGEIKIGIPPIIGAAFFSKLISRYKEAYPSIDILLTEVGSNKIKQGVAEGEIDIGLVCNLPIQRENFETIKLLKDPLMLIVQKDNPLAQKKIIEFSGIRKEPFIMYRRDFSLHDRIMEACGIHGFYPNVVCESSQKDFMIEMVEAKLGVALLPSKICDQINNKQIVAIPFSKPIVNLELGMIWKKDRYVPYAVRRFIAMAREFTV
ncbi:LysR family transcriptional regulator [Virgibacillus dakarensis]|uniref:HTH-type transcriptional regulator YwbI n=1 Tax=Lentibacillus populi TaxID=1827502 RepID=A0A9W5X755_9BACI|nr:LysR family transcriptional regulator [Lentibacillus populi]MBT2216273.1 LysR family transcriptional regulator [Virgibacillus dakarensis]MTW86963.1 LysR family transcriptional regulator [Virgibacillus dakarensis]GGB57580.1 putative HTH-type transcriptional regulator YwbI [Lentibacillus populi]